MAQKHFMISYNWEHQEEAKQIRDSLKQAGFSVWMDIDNGIKAGDVNQCMAMGVENAAAIICLVTEKYEKSKNCRRELSYADIKGVQ